MLALAKYVRVACSTESEDGGDRFLGNDTVHTHDALGRQSTETDRLGHTTSFAYTVLGGLESLTDAENQTTSYRYDGYARQSEVSWPDHGLGSSPGDLGYGITTTQHDDLNRATRTTDQLGDTVAMVYLRPWKFP